MDRREVLSGLSAVTLAVLTSNVAGAEGEMQGMDHQMEGMDHHHMHHEAKYGMLADAAADCVQKGQRCISHCIGLLAQGEKEMASCHASVHQTVAICSALQELANQESPHLAKVAAAAYDICKDCEDECRKHEKKHAVCKECGDACATCAKQCKEIAS